MYNVSRLMFDMFDRWLNVKYYNVNCR